MYGVPRREDILNELLHFGIELVDVDIVLLGGHDECDLK